MAKKKRVQFENHNPEFQQGVSLALVRGTAKMAINTHRAIVLSFTKNFVGDDVPIDSGQLRQSVRSNSDGHLAKTEDGGNVSVTQRLLKSIKAKRSDGRITVNKNYAIFVEYGTRFMAPRPVIRKGVADAEKENREIIEAEMGTIKLK